MQLLTVDTLEQAKDKLFAHLSRKTPATEKKPLSEALGSVLAEDIHAPFAVPHFRRSTVDGYAVNSLDTQGAGESIPSFLKIIGKVEMGEENKFSIQRGEAVYVPTGGMLPTSTMAGGADAMLMVEYAEKFNETEIACYQSLAPMQNVVERGEDIPKNSLVLQRGRVLRPHEIGVLASLGIAEIPVYAKPKMAIISLGDEILQAGEELAAGKVYDINTHGLYAQAQKFGFEVVVCQHIRDNREAILAALQDLVTSVDMICVSGGSSQGEKDFTAAVLAEVSTTGILTHGIAVKPGKPTITAYNEHSHCLLLGLPGHPVAAMLLFELLAVSVWQTYWNCSQNIPITARMACNFPGADGRLTCQLVQLTQEADNTYTAMPVFAKSGLISSLAKAHGYILVPMNSEGLHRDEQVFVYLL